MTNEELARECAKDFHRQMKIAEHVSALNMEWIFEAAIQKAVEPLQSEYDAFRDRIDAHLDRIEPKLDKSLSDVKIITGQKDVLESKCADLKRAIGRLREALDKYGGHESCCPRMRTAQVACTCGWSAILAGQRPKPKG